MNSFLKRFGPTIGVILILGVLGLVVKMQWDASKQREAINRQMIEMKSVAE